MNAGNSAGNSQENDSARVKQVYSYEAVDDFLKNYKIHIGSHRRRGVSKADIAHIKLGISCATWYRWLDKYKRKVGFEEMIIRQQQQTIKKLEEKLELIEYKLIGKDIYLDELL